MYIFSKVVEKALKGKLIEIVFVTLIYVWIVELSFSEKIEKLKS